MARKGQSFDAIAVIVGLNSVGSSGFLATIPKYAAVTNAERLVLCPMSPPLFGGHAFEYITRCPHKLTCVTARTFLFVFSLLSVCSQSRTRPTTSGIFSATVVACVVTTNLSASFCVGKPL